MSIIPLSCTTTGNCSVFRLLDEEQVSGASSWALGATECLEQVTGFLEQVTDSVEQVTRSLGHYLAINVKQSISLMTHILLQYIELMRTLNFNVV